MAWALGLNDFGEIGQQFSSLLKTDPDMKFMQKIEALFDLYKLSTSKPKEVKKAPCQEIIKDKDFSLFEYPICNAGLETPGVHHASAGHHQRPESGKQNLGMVPHAGL